MPVPVVSLIRHRSINTFLVLIKMPRARLLKKLHPTISTLVRETLYPHLRDHPDTASYPEIPGMKRRLFWLDHRNMEDASDPEEPMQSKTNMWEAKMVTALVRSASARIR